MAGGLLVLVPVVGAEVNGARRWINLGMRFQPSEFLKPGFAIALAPLILPIRGENDTEIAEPGGVGNRVVANLGDGAGGWSRQDRAKVEKGRDDGEEESEESEEDMDEGG